MKNKATKYICKEEYEVHSYQWVPLIIPFWKEVLIREWDVEGVDGVYDLLLDVSWFFLKICLDENSKNHYFTLHNPVVPDDQ